MANGNLVTIMIDDREVSVPAGTLVVEAAKQIGNDIPVFCYHPKMEPVGMCRMCLVEIGRPVVDRATGEFQKDETGKPKIQFGPKLETACTTPVSPGMVVRTVTDTVVEARREILEFLLTSHPLDCPICDKGGECPLQNLTFAHGPGKSRFLYDEKIHLAKHHPLGELIVLDRERCIQCGRCVRFQDEIVDDPVIGFYNRGRSLEIVTYSEPGFDSYFSGNTTDICPVGALTTSDFRFRARPWEMNLTASICPHCPVGCNLTLNVRREARSGGDTVIKRVMPRQNEAVNEIWICDKGRFGYHYTMSDLRLTKPMVRRGDHLAETTWEEALERIEVGLRAAGSNLLTLAGGRLSNEDLFNLRLLSEHQGGKLRLYSHMGGGDQVSRYGLTGDSNLKDLGKGSLILVVACDLEEEAPIWWLRVKQAAERGATLVVANPRATKLDRAATHSIRYPYGSESTLIKAFMPGSAAAAPDEVRPAVEAFATVENVVVIYGSEGLGLEGSQELAEAAGALLAATGHAGRINNGLIAAWPVGNDQGAWELGYRPSADLAGELAEGGAVYIAAADPAGEDPALAAALEKASFVVVQELTLSATAQLADVVLPVLAFTEREGTFTSGERRVQRFYPGVPSRSEARPDYQLAAQVASSLGRNIAGRSPRLIFRQMAEQIAAFSGLSYESISAVQPQQPEIGRLDLYYGGTAYDNHQGLGLRLAPVESEQPVPAEQAAQSLPQPRALPEADPTQGRLVAVPVTRLYDHGQTLRPSYMLHDRLTPTQVVLHPDQARQLNLVAGEPARVELNGVSLNAVVRVDESLPMGVALVPRSVGLPISAPSVIGLSPVGEKA